MIRLACANFLRLIQRSFFVSIIFFFCLTSAFGSFLLILEKGYKSYTDDVRQIREMQVLSFSSSDPLDIESFCKDIIEGNVLPPIESVSVSNDKITGILWNSAASMPSLYVPYGRFFTDSEMYTGENVALLGTGFFEELSTEEINTIWDIGIMVNDKSIQVIGNYYYEWPEELQDELFRTLQFPTLVSIPLQTFFSIGLEATKCRCVFAQELTDSQRSYLKTLLCASNNITYCALPKATNESAASSFIEEIKPYALFVVLCAISIVSVALYWMHMEFWRYKVYLTCGATHWQIIVFLSINIILLMTLAYMCACVLVALLTMVAPKGILSFLPLRFHVATYSFGLIGILIMVILRAIPLVFHEKIITQ